MAVPQFFIELPYLCWSQWKDPQFQRTFMLKLYHRFGVLLKFLWKKLFVDGTNFFNAASSSYALPNFERNGACSKALTTLHLLPTTSRNTDVFWQLVSSLSARRKRRAAIFQHLCPIRQLDRSLNPLFYRSLHKRPANLVSSYRQGRAKQLSYPSSVFTSLVFGHSSYIPRSAKTG